MTDIEYSEIIELRTGACTKVSSGKRVNFIEYNIGVKLFMNGILDGIVSKEYFKENYEVKG